MGLERYLNFKPEDLCVDIYGQKPLNNRKYLLTTKIYDYKVIKSFALEMRPQEANIINNIIGNSIFLYNTAIKNNNRHFYFNKTRNFIYYYKLQSHFFNIIKTVGLMTYNKIKKIIRHKR
ncbi:hypothetical protein NBRC111894_1760 [Sporolactobacillus inulinus]|uniref:Uncharacterized protein n=1 Tax=Sporolactobacillus inulinus TaxID=2078 RepID=A0A4Y1ZAW2_9BACL|nr:hypothetical protein [Sporolactobacillus inulinus]GAY76206.1 hypothetical protein NBRC111894_1760 [Sporolactobacillus inulinus]